MNPSRIHLDLDFRARFMALFGVEVYFVCGLISALMCGLTCACERQPPHEPVDQSTAVSSKDTSGDALRGRDVSKGGRKVSETQVSTGGEQLSAAHQFRDGELRLEIEPLVIARDVKHRRAIGAAITFPNTVESLWGLASVRARGQSVQLSLRWWREHELVSVNPFVVSEGIKWSEWSQVTISPRSVGSWRVELFYPREHLHS